jgi:hypothetical protein
MIQKHINGWYFFPQHVDYVSFSIEEVLNKLERCAAYVFIYQGRNVLFFSAIILAIISLVRKKDIPFKRELLYLLIFIVGFIVFSALNFYSDRYVMAVIPPFIVMCVLLISEYLKTQRIILVAIVIVIGVQIDRIKNLSNSDHNMGYANAVKCHQQMVKFFERNDLKDKNINCYFLGREVLTKPVVGYVSSSFPNITKEITNTTEYIVVANFDTDKKNILLLNNPNYQLAHSIEIGQAWIKILKTQ